MSNKQDIEILLGMLAGGPEVSLGYAFSSWKPHLVLATFLQISCLCAKGPGTGINTMHFREHKKFSHIQY